MPATTLTRRAFSSLPPTALLGATPARPIIILILADDLGYSDLGCYGGEIRTPNPARPEPNRLRREVRIQNSEVRSQNSEVRSQKSEVRSQNGRGPFNGLGSPILREGPPDQHEYWLRKHYP